MRLYGKRFVKNFVDRRVRLKTETRDAIVWDLDWVNYVAKVKIQGSNEYVMAHFPRNWKETPYWLKKGNAVSIRHREGNKGYIEVIGEGRAIPTAVEGGSMPEPDSEPDMVLTGLEVTATEPTSLGVWVSSGSYRINSIIYYIFPASGEYVVMDDPAPMVMSSSGDEIMGGGIASIEFDPAPAEGYYRYDMITVGTDSQIDYTVGTPHRTDPQYPSVPTDHLLLAYVLVRWSSTYIADSDIDAEFQQVVPSTLEIEFSASTGASFSGEYMEYTPSGESGYPNPQANVAVQCYDQYGLSLSISGTMTLELVSGSGDIYSATTGWDSSEVTQSASWGGYTFKYRRDETGSESSPAFRVTFDTTGSSIQAAGMLVLLDSLGGYVPF